MKQTKVVIIGAGPAGVGCAALLKQMNIKSQEMLIYDASTIGSSFEGWPREMRMITPSFPSNGFHQTDLNAITPDTSPAFNIGKEHPTGEEYARYLRNVVEHYDIKVHENSKITRVFPDEECGFLLNTEAGETIRTQYVIWAGGEFSAPRVDGFNGSSLCIHNSEIASWDECSAEHYIVIGGYESGVDAAFNLATRGKRVTILEESSAQQDTYDPSRVLSPHTAERLASMANMELVELEQGFEVEEVYESEFGYSVISKAGTCINCRVKPINCTGFHTHLGPVNKLFEMTRDGLPIVNQYDESTKHRNLFLSGPKLVHGNILLCFIYKFRGRFITPCSIIGAELGLDTSILSHYQQAGMFLDDFTCCETQQCFC